MGFSISPLGIRGGQHCPKKMGAPISSRSVFKFLCAGRATPCLYTKKWDFPFHYWMFLTHRFPLSRELSSQSHQDISVMSKIYGKQPSLSPSPNVLQSTQPCTGGRFPSALHVLAVYRRGIDILAQKLEISIQRYKAGILLLVFSAKKQVKSFWFSWRALCGI